jgi:hypothetical protein
MLRPRAPLRCGSTQGAPAQTGNGAGMSWLLAGHVFRDAAAVIVDGAAAGFFFGDFGFFCSRLLRFCPLAMSFPLPCEYRHESGLQENRHQEHIAES